jgi:hypothetical protein
MPDQKEGTAANVRTVEFEGQKFEDRGGKRHLTAAAREAIANDLEAIGEKALAQKLRASSDPAKLTTGQKMANYMGSPMSKTELLVYIVGAAVIVVIGMYVYRFIKNRRHNLAAKGENVVATTATGANVYPLTGT